MDAVTPSMLERSPRPVPSSAGRRTLLDRAPIIAKLTSELAAFDTFGKPTECRSLRTPTGIDIPVFVNEFWTAKQRAAHSLHEVSYRACFKPQLPRFFIERLTAPGDLVYDPFMGRGTTLVEAALLDRKVAGCDVNPLGKIFTEPRLRPPSQEAVAARLADIDLTWTSEVRDELEVFYHPTTLGELTALRDYLLARISYGVADDVDRWIHMVATNRLTGHSAGFFSVYTLPPNQAVTLASQRRINERRGQRPTYRDVKALILRKSTQLLSDFKQGGLPPDLDSSAALLMTRSCESTPELADNSVTLVVTSPPFLDLVDYAADNWLRGWFCGFDTATLPIWRYRRLEDWAVVMERVFREISRVLVSGGHVAFEVGDVRGGAVVLENVVADIATKVGLVPELVLINTQNFTKTANCWGVKNQLKGTNTNRVVVIRKI